MRAIHRGLRDVLLVVTGGLLYAAALPPHDWSACAWLTLVPLLTVAARANLAGALAAGFGYGVVLFAATVPWVVSAVAAYFASGVAGAFAVSAAICVLFVAGYTALFAAAARRLLSAGACYALVGVPALWVAYELARSTLLTGLPWQLLGHSQWRQLSLVQVADLAGAYGVSFVVAAVNVGVYLALAAGRTDRFRPRALAPLATALGLVVAVVAYGQWRIAGESGRGPATAATLALVQGNHASEWRWERARAERGLLLYVGLSRRAVAERPADLVVWPEYALTLYPERDVAVLPALRNLAAQTRAGLVFGAPRGDGNGPAARFHNAAYHVAPDGRLRFYDKVHLVPFAEYQPLTSGEALAAAGDREFSAGSGSRVLSSAAGRLGMLICYEVVFPALTRELVRQGAEVLVNLSNDGWLDGAGLGAGAQHFSMTVFRAVETRRFIARAASTGISGFVDPIGRPFARLEAGRQGTTWGDVEPRTEITAYVRVGDLFAFACVGAGLVALLASLASGRTP